MLDAEEKNAVLSDKKKSVYSKTFIEGTKTLTAVRTVNKIKLVTHLIEKETAYNT